MIWGFIAVFFYARYKITKKLHDEIKAELAINAFSKKFLKFTSGKSHAN
jgi:hypothetical protein